MPNRAKIRQAEQTKKALSAKGRWRLVLFLLVFLWMALIFSFSSQNGTKSSQTSGRVVERLVSLLRPDYETLPQNEQESLLQIATVVVRKGAHFTEYLILGVLLYLLCSTYTQTVKRRLWISFLIGTAYAATDEIHQLFSSGRAGRITDVGIDSLGTLTGILLCTLLAKIIARRRSKNSKEDERTNNIGGNI